MVLSKATLKVRYENSTGVQKESVCLHTFGFMVIPLDTHLDLFFFFFRKCLSKKISILVRLSAQLERLGENVQ